jgi:hypothetical protein
MDQQNMQEPALASVILNRSAASTTILSPNTAPAAPITTEAEFQAKKQREAGRSGLDYTAAVIRQDSPIPGLVSSMFGWDHVPQPGYSTYANPEDWKGLTEGIAPEYHNEFLDAASPAHAQYIRGRLLEKQNDLQTLADMGTLGTVGRLAYGVTEPTALIAGLLSGGVGMGTKAGTLVKTLTGAAVGGGTMAGVEKLRQSVNFENDYGRVLEAGLLAGLMTAPFAYAGARASTRVATAARKEMEALELLKRQHEGEELSPGEIQTLHEVQKAADTTAAVENGTASATDMDAIWAAHDNSKASLRAKQLDDAWSAHENAQASLRNKQLDDLQSEGELHKGDEMNEVSNALAEVNNAPEVPLSAMELAFQKALGKAVVKKAGKAETPLHLQAIPDKAPLAELQGENVFWHSDEGSGIDHGMVTGETAKGELIVEHADTGERVLVDRGDLHHDSPGHYFEIPKEAATGDPQYHPVLDVEAMPTPPAVISEQAPARYEPAPVSRQQSASTAAPEGRSGFLEGSIGSAQVEHVSILDTVFNGFVPGLDKLGIKIPLRFDLYAQLNRSENPVIQKWASKFIKDPIGSPDGFTQGRTASEEKRLMQRQWEGQTMLAAQGAFNKVREIRGIGPLEAQKFHSQFFEMVSDVTRGDARVLQANSDIAAAGRRRLPGDVCGDGSAGQRFRSQRSRELGPR